MKCWNLAFSYPDLVKFHYFVDTKQSQTLCMKCWNLAFSYPDLVKFHYFVDTKQNENSLSSPPTTTTTTKEIDPGHMSRAIGKNKSDLQPHRWHRLLTYTTQHKLISFTYDTCTSLQHPPAVHHARWMMMMMMVCGLAKTPYFFLCIILVT